jgi:hypothetical protein
VSGSTSTSGTASTPNASDAFLQQMAQAVAAYMQSAAGQAGMATGSLTSTAT